MGHNSIGAYHTVFANVGADNTDTNSKPGTLTDTDGAILFDRLFDDRNLRIFISMKIIGYIYPVSGKNVILNNNRLCSINLIEVADCTPIADY